MTARHRGVAAPNRAAGARAASPPGRVAGLPRRARRAGRRRIIVAGAVVVMSAVMSVPGIANALFAGAAPTREADVTAASIQAPATFTATATSSTSATLAWSGPVTRTGYILSQSPGTLVGCPATPSGGSTGCVATGLAQGTAYTWTLRAAYNNWLSPGFTATATTSGFAVDLGNGGTCDSSRTCAGPTVTTNYGRYELIFIYVSGSSSSSIDSISGPWSRARRYARQRFPSSESYNYLYVYQATGTGSGPAGTTVNFETKAADATMWMDVVELGAGESALSSCDSCTARDTTGPARATISVQRDTHKKIAFLGSANGGGFLAAAGFSVLGGGTGEYGTYASAVITEDSYFAMSPNGNWGSVSLEISP